MRRALLIALVLLVAAGSGTAGAAAPKLALVITAQSHHPKVHHTWWYEVKVTADGKPVACKIHVQMWFGGSSVGEIGTHVVKNGVWRETIVATGPNAFPPASVGQPLVLHATATAKGYRAGSAGWNISVVK
ncbi:MAG TPA: hypothetical protein VN770_04105 [Gaiellaceae bacterium]|nr:hypothetical protein [Gaiellaceae bacterium]